MQFLLGLSEMSLFGMVLNHTNIVKLYNTFIKCIMAS